MTHVPEYQYAGHIEEHPVDGVNRYPEDRRNLLRSEIVVVLNFNAFFWLGTG